MPNSAISFNTSGLATTTSPGLVGTGAQTFAGDKTFNGLVSASGGIINTGLTGTNATTAFTFNSGKVGEYTEVVSGNTSVSYGGTGLWNNIASFTLNSGIWCITLNLIQTANGATMTATPSQIGISTDSGANSFTDTLYADTRMDFPPSSASADTCMTMSKIVKLSSSTLYYAKARAVYSAGTPKYFYKFSAVRIA